MSAPRLSLLTRTSIAIVTLLLLPAAGVSGQTAAAGPPAVEVELGIARAQLPTRVGLYTAIGEAASRGADLGLDKVLGKVEGRGIGRASVRLARLWLVSFPIAALTTTAAHNAGHFARADEIHRGDHVLHVTQWPWPVPVVSTIEWSDADFSDPSARLSIVGGGEQGSALLRDRLIDKIHSGDQASLFDWILVGYAAMELPAYAWTDLQPSHLVSQEAFYADAADFRQYLGVQAEQLGPMDHAPSFGKRALQIRRSAWLNFADVTVLSAFMQTARYVRTGERPLANPAIPLGRLRLVAGAYAALGSIGLERGVDVRLMSRGYLAHVNLRSTSVLSRGARHGAGIGLRPRRETAIGPEAQLDVWRRLDGQAGVRFEAGFRGRLRKGAQPLVSAFRIGYKTEGYLNDAPYRAGLLASISTGVRF